MKGERLPTPALIVVGKSGAIEREVEVVKGSKLNHLNFKVIFQI